MCKFFKKWWNKELPEEIEIPDISDYIEGQEISAFEEEIMVLIQGHRHGLGLKQLKMNPDINKVAAEHSNYMAKVNKASHWNFLRREQLIKESPDANHVKEIVAGGYGTAHGVMGREPEYIITDDRKIRKEIIKGTGWLGSDDHRKVIEWKTAKGYGIAVSKSYTGKMYYTIIFIN